MTRTLQQRLIEATRVNAITEERTNLAPNNSMYTNALQNHNIVTKASKQQTATNTGKPSTKNTSALYHFDHVVPKQEPLVGTVIGEAIRNQ